MEKGRNRKQNQKTDLVISATLQKTFIFRITINMKSFSYHLVCKFIKDRSFF